MYKKIFYLACVLNLPATVHAAYDAEATTALQNLIKNYPKKYENKPSDAIKELGKILNKKPDVNAQTFLHSAAQNGITDIKFYKKLLEAGANPLTTDHNRLTPRQYITKVSIPQINEKIEELKYAPISGRTLENAIKPYAEDIERFDKISKLLEKAEQKEQTRIRKSETNK
jgi:hypothetical protein